ncbi:MAG: hypothetical protein ACOC8A_01825, partial [bacterium]
MLGAGASAFCDIANPERRPPLLRQEDFLRMLDNPLRGGVVASALGPMGLVDVLREALLGLDGDVEALTTALYYVSREHSFDGIALRLGQELQDDELCDHTIALAERLSEITDVGLPANVLRFFTGALTEEISFCLGTTSPVPGVRRGYAPLSADHAALA